MHHRNYQTNRVVASVPLTDYNGASYTEMRYTEVKKLHLGGKGSWARKPKMPRTAERNMSLSAFYLMSFPPRSPMSPA